MSQLRPPESHMALFNPGTSPSRGFREETGSDVHLDHDLFWGPRSTAQDALTAPYDARQHATGEQQHPLETYIRSYCERTILIPMDAVALGDPQQRDQELGSAARATEFLAHALRSEDHPDDGTDDSPLVRILTGLRKLGADDATPRSPFDREHYEVISEERVAQEDRLARPIGALPQQSSALATLALPTNDTPRSCHPTLQLRYCCPCAALTRPLQHCHKSLRSLVVRIRHVLLD